MVNHGQFTKFTKLSHYTVTTYNTLNLYTLGICDEILCDDSIGYLLLAGKVRTSAEEDAIRTTVEKHFKRQINPSSLFGHEEPSSHTTVDILTSLLHGQQSEQFGHLVWTYGLKRLAVLLGRAVKFDEPVLLVGETG